MTFCRLTDEHLEGQPVFLNPAHVIAVQRMENYTWVRTAATNSDGSSLTFVVSETAEEVVRMLEAAAARA